MKLHDVLYNWLQMKIVLDARPTDKAAKDTYDFFYEILIEDHHVSNISVEKDEERYIIHYEMDGVNKKQMFDAYTVEKLLEDINSEPKYNQ